jgi:molybdenum cofactor cytidylyltransferase
VAGALLHQVDFPDVAVATVRSLAEAWARDASAFDHLFVPVHAGRRGHPILLGRALWPEVLALGPDEPLSRVVHRDGGRVIEVATCDPGIHSNRNTPEEAA